MDTVWYFEPGSSACEDCQNAAGYYATRPDGPHPDTCDCVVIEHEIEAGSFECDREYRNVDASTSGGANASTQYKFNTCGEDDKDITVESPIDVEDNLGSELRNAMEGALGWSPPDHVTELDVSVMPNHRGTIEVEAVVEVVTGSAEVWQVCRVGNVKVQQKIDDLIGTYSYVSAITYDIDDHMCIR